MKFQFPVNEIAITQDYHNGYCIDFGNISGTKNKYQPIYACADGKVVKIEKQDTGGNVLYIEHNNKWISQYAHLKEILVKVGQIVKIGEQVAIMGKTGSACNGIHLHFTILKKLSYMYKKTKLYMIPCLDYLFIAENQKTSKTTAKKYPKLLKSGETKTCTGNKVRIRQTPTISLLNVTKHKLNKGDKVKIYAYSNGFYKISSDKELWVSATYLK